MLPEIVTVSSVIGFLWIFFELWRRRKEHNKKKKKTDDEEMKPDLVALIGRGRSTGIMFSFLRYNPLKDEWVIVAPQRCKRPWQGQTEQSSEEKVPVFDPSNPLCPGVTRTSGEKTPVYESTYVFPNDFPALTEDQGRQAEDGQEFLFQWAPARGNCHVMCFHPRSDLQLATMGREDVLKVIQTWIEQTQILGKRFDWVQIFENKGAVMGCSNPHPHCQIWSSEFMPNEPAKKMETQKSYWEKKQSVMLLDYAQQELDRKERIVVENHCWVVLVPYWAVWPYETLLLPKSRHILRITDLTECEKKDLAEIMQRLLIHYDNLFQCTFPYSMGWAGAPTGKYLEENVEYWQLHAVYLPPLLRSAAVKKFMAGYEMVCEPQRDITPEMAAETLRNLSDVHYSKWTD